MGRKGALCLPGTWLLPRGAHRVPPVRGDRLAAPVGALASRATPPIVGPVSLQLHGHLRLGLPESSIRSVSTHGSINEPCIHIAQMIAAAISGTTPVSDALMHPRTIPSPLRTGVGVRCIEASSSRRSSCAPMAGRDSRD